MQQYSEFVVHHWALFAALAVILVLLAWNLGLGVFSSSKVLDPGQATRLINRDNPVVIDVRARGDFEQGHIIDAVHVAMEELSDRLKTLEKYKDRPVLIYCRAGNTSSRAVAMLRKAGFPQVYHLKGGILAWQNAGLPLTR
jgi:rhodanese-related sulfurtransferase